MDTSSEFLQLTLVPLLIALLACIACALPGNFLVLRRQSLVGDAISHVALLGIVGAFVFTGSLDTTPMLLGAMLSAVLAVSLIELIRFLGKVEPGAAMGVVFTALFATGVLLLEQSNSSSVHLDVEHVLYGNLESLLWLDAQDWSSLTDPEALSWLPHQLPRLAWVLLIVVVFLIARWRELVIGTFDADFAASIGARPSLTNLALLVVVALVAVASFEAVGAIIVVAMFICPAATARLMTDSLKQQMILSVVFASIAATGGYILAAWGPLWLGYEDSVSAAGMIALLSGLMLLIAALAGPRRR